MTGRLGPLRMPAFDGTQGCANAHDLWDTAGRNAEAAKRAICHACAFQPECLAWALDTQHAGFWAGHNATQLKAVRDRYGITCRSLEAHR